MRQAEALPDRAAVADGPVAGRRPGRPRSERAERAILEAALDLFAESGVGGVCMEAVAARAGVGKATIYRRWPGKEDLLLDALTSLKSPLPEPGGESVREDLVAMLRVMCQDAADPRWARRYTLLLGEGEKYPKVMERYKETVVEPRRDMIRSVLRRGVASAELRPDVDVEVAMFMLTGAVLARGRHDAEWITPEYAERVVDEVLLGLAPRGISP
jgi:AcrR family transcriptional regulator